MALDSILTSPTQRVLVVGNANSGNDIAAHLAPVAEPPVHQSIRRMAFPGFPSLPDDRIRMVAPVLRYSLKLNEPHPHLHTPRIDVQLTDGTEIPDIDAVLIGTGYKPCASFIHVYNPTPDKEKRVLEPILTDAVKPYRIPSLHRHILYAHNPSLAFIGSALSYTPFTIADVASTWLALAWQGEVRYPDTAEGRLVYEKERLEDVESVRASMDSPSSLLVYNVLGANEQEYASRLKEDIVAARPGLAEVLPEWNDERTKVREAMFKTKLEALQYAHDRRASAAEV